MILYHRTTLEAAEAISIGGFGATGGDTCAQPPQQNETWLADRPTRIEGCAEGDVVLRLKIPDQLVLPYLRDRIGDCRLFLVPVSVANAYLPVQPCDDQGNPIDFCRAATGALRAQRDRIVAESGSASAESSETSGPGLTEIARQIQRYSSLFAEP
jgi:hypothetical protein